MLEQLSQYEELAKEIIPEEVLIKLSPEERRVVGLIVCRTIRKLKNCIHDQHGFKIKAALERAKSNGTRLGRPSVINAGVIKQVHNLRSQGLSWKQISREVGLGAGTVFRVGKIRPPNDGASSPANAPRPQNLVVVMEMLAAPEIERNDADVGN